MLNNKFFITGAFIVVGFILGSVPFCRIIPKIILKKDICELSDDGNPGASNVFVHCGIPMGLLCLLCDMAKGFLPVFAVMNLVGFKDLAFSAVMVAPILGHALGVFNKRKGGKCIATSFGVLIAVLPVDPIGLVLAFIYIFLAGIIRVRPNARCSVFSFSIFAAVAFPTLIIQSKTSLALGCLGMSALAILKHIKSLPRRKNVGEIKPS